MSSVVVKNLSHQFSRELVSVPLEKILLSWQVESHRAATTQLGYEIEHDSSELFSAPVSTGMVASDKQLEVELEKLVPSPRAVYFVRVRVQTESGVSEWSQSLRIEFSVPHSEIQGQAISSGSRHSEPADLFRKEFDLPSRAKSARLYFSSHGVVQPSINGYDSWGEYLMPGWTAYQERLNLVCLDVTKALQSGTNVLGFELADGWFRGKLGFMNKYDNYGVHTSVIGQLEIELEDGSRMVVETDSSWKTSTSNVIFSDIYDGSTVDFNLTQAGWSKPDFDSTTWKPVKVVDFDKEKLVPRHTKGITQVGSFPMTISNRAGNIQLDSGQNIAGWVRLRVKGSKGTEVTVRHAEVLESDGALHTKALRSAKSTAKYILGKDGISTLESRFTFHGFQYAEVAGDVEVIDAVAIAISSASEPRSSFVSADQRLNKLHSNVVWSQLDNFVGIPTDCPQRDERLGWTGDAQAFSYTASTLFDTEAFWRSWLIDLEIDQDPVEGVPAVVPDLIRLQPSVGGWKTIGRAGWADAATIVPDAVYQSYGSEQILRQQLNSMRMWVDSLNMRRDASGLLPTEFQFGDWCDPDAPEDQPWLSKVSADFVANSFFVKSASLLAGFEKILGNHEMHKKYLDLSKEMANLTWEAFGEESVKTTAGASIALQFSVCPEDMRGDIAKDLAAMVRADKGKITTGFLGTPLILFALEEAGYTDEAFMMLLRREIRSWLYQVDSGATTIWERWDAIREDGSIHTGDMATENEHQEDASMISFNHYAYGAVIDWVYHYVAGIARDPESPGYKKFVVSPRPTESIGFAKATVESKYGPISIDWKLDEGDLQIKLVVPFGTRAVLDLPTSESSTVKINGIVHNGEELTNGEHLIIVSNPEVAGI